MSTKKQKISPEKSYWQIFRLIFVIFSFYLVGDALYRWNGFRYYASFYEFIPSVALIAILWSIISALTALLSWLFLITTKKLLRVTDRIIKADYLLMFTCLLLVLGLTTWFGKRFFFSGSTTVQTKSIVFLCVALISAYLAWLYRSKAERLIKRITVWVGVIQDRITIWVWVFFFIIIFSFPVVIYHAWLKDEANKKVEGSVQFSKIENSKHNIILITFDSLTERDMSVYGYHRPTTPFIDKWARNASLFKRAKAVGNYTLPTTSSIMTGKRVWTHQSYFMEGVKPIKSDIENLALILKQNGYINMAFVASDHTSPKELGMENSFHIAPPLKEFTKPKALIGFIDISLKQLFGGKILLHDWIIKGDFALSKILSSISGDYSTAERPADLTFKKTLDIINSNLTQPFFVWIHLDPPHSPYLPPDPYMGVFDSSSQFRTFDSQVKDWLRIEHPEQIIWDRIRARYDEYILYCDYEFNNFISQLPMNIMKNTVIILSADHGESFSFEHDYREHGGQHLYEEVTHIPLIIKEPGQSQGQVIDDLVEQIDIPPTILELAGITIPPWMEGHSLMPHIKGMSVEPRQVISTAFVENPGRGNPIRKGTIAIWEGDYKLIHYLGDNKSLLFNLGQDPGELNNIFDKETVVGQHLLTIIQEELKKANNRISKGE